MVMNVPVRDKTNLSQQLHDETYVDRHNDHDIRKAGYVFQKFKDKSSGESSINQLNSTFAIKLYLIYRNVFPINSGQPTMSTRSVVPPVLFCSTMQNMR